MNQKADAGLRVGQPVPEVCLIAEQNPLVAVPRPLRHPSLVEPYLVESDEIPGEGPLKLQSPRILGFDACFVQFLFLIRD